MQNNIAIRVTKLTKEFILFSHIKDSFLYHFGFKFLVKNRSALPKICPLKDISFEVRQGERVAILGKNGAGKTTLLKIISEFMYPTSGKILVVGKKACLFSINSGVIDELTGYENIQKSTVTNSINYKELNVYVEDIIDFSELRDVIHKPVYTYSQGMKARLQFAIATAIRPDILIIDEVLGAGDAYFANKSYQRIKKLIADDQCTLLMVSHNVSNIEMFCNRALLIHDGMVLKDGTTSEVIPLYLSITKPQANAGDTASVEHGGKWNKVCRSNRPHFLENNVNNMEGRQVEGRYKDLTIAETNTKFYSFDNRVSLVNFHCFFRSAINKDLLYVGDSLLFEMKLAKNLSSDRCLIFIRIYDNYSQCVASFSQLIDRNKDTMELILNPLIFGAGDYQVSLQFRNTNDEVVELYPNVFSFLVNYANESDPPLYHLPGEWNFGGDIVNARLSPYI